MRLIVAALFLVGTVGQTGSAQVRQFPYDATVQSGSALVRSGPGQKYYATGRLNRGDRVTVHRHDLGGWYMIAPPAGSFSWIRADAVNRLDEHRGVLADNNVIVRVGSSLDDSRDVFQTRLSTGAPVEILGEKTFQTETGSVRMYKITPPRGEWRWVAGHAVTPVDRSVRAQRDRDPYSIPSHARRQSEPSESTNASGPELLRNSEAEEEPRQSNLPVVKTSNSHAVRRSGPSSFELNRDRRRLRRLDETFREIIEDDISRWDFAELRQEYLNLQRQTSHPALAGQIDVRLASLDRHEAIKADYDGFIQLTAETQQRDAQLMTLQREKLRPTGGTANSPDPATEPKPVPPARAPGRPVHPKYVVPGRLAPRPGVLNGNVFRQPGRQPARRVPSAPQVVPQKRMAAPRFPVAPGQPVPRQPRPQAYPARESPVGVQPKAGRRPPMVAAGIVQRAIASSSPTPAHVLLEPSGRILAYLQPARGVNLDAYLGRSVGLFGRRTPSSDLQTNVIVVEGVTPVRLQR